LCLAKRVVDRARLQGRPGDAASAERTRRCGGVESGGARPGSGSASALAMPTRSLRQDSVLSPASGSHSLPPRFQDVPGGAHRQEEGEEEEEGEEKEEEEEEKEEGEGPCRGRAGLTRPATRVPDGARCASARGRGRGRGPGRPRTRAASTMSRNSRPTETTLLRI
ncbi:unnamed protein product, partial [Prorocentrum cordatum]